MWFEFSHFDFPIGWDIFAKISCSSQHAQQHKENFNYVENKQSKSEMDSQEFGK